MQAFKSTQINLHSKYCDKYFSQQLHIHENLVKQESHFSGVYSILFAFSKKQQ